MKVLIIGGIYGMSDAFRNKNLQETTETLLEAGLRRHGVEVGTQPHRVWNEIRGYDLVHVHHLANSALQFQMKRRAPLVFTRHATKAIPIHHMAVLNATYRRADALVTLSGTEHHSLPRAFRSKATVIYNGVDTSTCVAGLRRSPPSGDRWKLLYVGQLIALKRVHLALQLVARLYGNGHDVHLDIVSQRETLLLELTHMTRKLGIEDRVTFHGPMSKAEVAQIMGRSHLLVLPSRTEGLSTVVNEATVCGLPVLAFDVGGMREQLPNDWKIPRINDVEAYLDLGAAILDDYDAAAGLFFQEATIFQARFSVETMVLKHLRIYRSLVGVGR